MIVVNCERLEGHEIVEYLGFVKGKSVELLAEHAQQLGANAVINVRIAVPNDWKGTTLFYGTAVKIRIKS